MNSMTNNKIFYLILFFLSISAIGVAQQRRIVSLAPSITESLFELGVGDEVVGVTSYCNNPPEATKKTVIGNLSNTNIEKIYSLKPDLVIAVTGLNKPQTISKLKSLGIKVVEVTEGNSYQELLDNFLTLGKIVGREKQAQEKIKKIDAEIKKIYTKCKPLQKQSVFLEFGDQPLVTLGSNTFSNDYLKYSSGYNIFAEMPMKYPKINREDVLKRDPDIILIITMGLATEKEKSYWASFKNLKAVKNNKIFIVDSNHFCRPTPMSFITAFREIAKIIHPELKID
jgi:iron complex transport system substrate-binding protein